MRMFSPEAASAFTSTPSDSGFSQMKASPFSHQKLPVDKAVSQNPFMTTNVFSNAGAAKNVFQSAVSPPTTAPTTSESTSDTQGELRYTCNLCQKTFRLESALIHHMSFKHNQVMAPGSIQPTSGGADAPSEGPNVTTEDSTSREKTEEKPAGANDFVTPFSPNSEYAAKVRDAKKEAANKLPPEEVTISCHASCVNTIVLVGRLIDLQIGFVWEERVLQFSIICPFPNPPAGESDRDVVVVRYYLGQEDTDAFEKYYRRIINDGKPVCVIGSLRMNPQMEKVNSKYYYYPFVYARSIQLLE
uniref:C2H2-type domain-containing protein n=1 Tax=Paramoeba aestuarina TaxID=180227 RepID=A0A7S4PAL3_9EUKA|mmetsp:Transcript_39063/g.61836  ORF Transcript_39063/g.61836 Transcript_39063/m.61836 type:complete len:302 (+) Transcript_39063:3-908(+)